MKITNKHLWKQNNYYSDMYQFRFCIYDRYYKLLEEVFCMRDSKYIMHCRYDNSQFEGIIITHERT